MPGMAMPNAGRSEATSEVAPRRAAGAQPAPGASDEPRRFPELPPLDPADEYACTLMGLLIEVHARLVGMLGAQMEEACGLPLGWYDAMIRLRRSPGGFTTMTRLASEVSLTSGGITRLVDRLVEAGYAERSGCPTDRRSVYVHLTPAGVAKVDEATASHRTVLEEHLIGPLCDDERAALESVLRKLRRA
jgi:MarR family transcriptional regulator, 2-MHQ and catechol-resistance regulon repressor